MAAVATGWLAFGGPQRIESVWLDAVFILSVTCFLICLMGVLSRQIRHFS